MVHRAHLSGTRAGSVPLPIGPEAPAHQPNDADSPMPGD